MAVINSVDKFYRAVIENVLLECRELFLDDEVDEAVLTELKQMWERKIKQAKVFEFSNLKPANSSFNMGSYGIIASSRNVGCSEILVPSIHLTAPRGDGSKPCTPTATIALPYGLYQQQISALNNAGISLQPSGNGQFLAFLRPDQTRLQSLTVSQSRQVAGKVHSIAVSTPSVAPVKPELVKLNLNTAQQPNRALTTSVPTKTVPELNKQKNLPAQGTVVNNNNNNNNNKPNGNITVKVTENLRPQPPLNVNNNNNGGSSNTNKNNNGNCSNTTASSNAKSVEDVTSKINVSGPNKDKTVPSNTKDIPNNSTSGSSSVNTVGGFSSNSNSNNNNSNSAMSSTCKTAVTTNATLATFNAAQNTQPPLNASSTNANSSDRTQMYNTGAYYNNQQPCTQLHNYGHQPNDDNNNNGYPGSYDDRVYQIGAAFRAPKQPESLDDFMDNLCDTDSNNSNPYGYPPAQATPINADRNVTGGFTSSVNTVGNLMTTYPTSDCYSNNNNNNNNNPHSLFVPALTNNYKRDPFDGEEAMHGQTSRFSEEDMKTIDEILQLDGAGDEYEFQNSPKSILLQPGVIRGFSSERQPEVKTLKACKINNCQTCKTKSEKVYKITNANKKSNQFKNRNYFLGTQSPFQCLKIRNTLKGHFPRGDYVWSKPDDSTDDNLVLSRIADTSVVDLNSTLNKDDKEYNLKTEIKKSDFLVKNKKSHFYAPSVSKQTPELALKRSEILPKVTKDELLRIKFGYLRPDPDSSTNSVHDLRQSLLTIKDVPSVIGNPNSPKPQTMVSEKNKDTETRRGYGSFFRASISCQFDGEDADSSSSSDDNIKTKDAPSDDDNDEDDDDDDDEGEEATEEVEDVAIESEPLNSADDDSDIDICAMFESDNIVVCQFEKISRNKNKWKFHLKDGIMNLYGRDLIFSKSVGEAEW